jgi:hypothetical protein
LLAHFNVVFHCRFQCCFFNAVFIAVFQCCFSTVFSDYQGVEHLSMVEPLGSRRPSDLLATMLELCPREHESCPFFCFTFLQKLPQEIRVLLAKEDIAIMQVKFSSRLLGFLKAQVKFPIIGIDFSSYFCMMGDPAMPHVGGSATPSSCMALTTLPLVPAQQAQADCRIQLPAAMAAAKEPPAAPQSKPPAARAGQPYAEILIRPLAALVGQLPEAIPGSLQGLHKELPAVFATDWGQQPPLHHVVHTIKTKGWPVTTKFCYLNPGCLEAAKAEFKCMQDAGIIRRSKSQLSSPLHMVPKKDGTWGSCGDFCCLNLITAADCYPLPNMADCPARLDRCQVFSKLDLQKAYLQVPEAQGDIPKTAVITQFVLFKFV